MIERDKAAKKELFLELLDLSRDQQKERLSVVRFRDPPLAQAVEELLRCARGPSPGFLKQIDTPNLPQTIGRYEITAHLGSGGMSEVYLGTCAEHPFRPLAIKVLRPGLATEAIKSRFRFERDTLFQIWHENVARILDAGDDPEVGPWIAMERIVGKDILKHATAHRSGLGERIRLLTDTVSGLVAIHAKGILHRDLKPGNILVDEGITPPTPKVIDFGIAGSSNAAIKKSHNTSIGLPLGTFSYMSPEQMIGDIANIDQRSDVYSMGVVAYELLTGHLPRNPETLAYLSVQGFFEGMERIPVPSLLDSWDKPRQRAHRAEVGMTRIRELDAILKRAIQPRPHSRYSDARALLKDLIAWREGQPLETAVPSRLYRLRKWLMINQRIWAPTVIVFVCLLALIFNLDRSRRRIEGAQHETAVALAASRSLCADLDNSAEFLARVLATIAITERPPEFDRFALMNELSLESKSLALRAPIARFALHNGLAEAFRLEGHLSQAEEHHALAGEALKALSSHEEFISLSAQYEVSHGLLAMDRGLSELAREHFHRSLNRERRHDEHSALKAETMLVVLDLRHSAIDPAEAALRELVAIWDRGYPTNRTRLTIRAELIEALVITNNLREARALLSEARSILKEKTVKVGRIDPLILDTKEVRILEAERDLEAALALSRATSERLANWVGVHHPDYLVSKLRMHSIAAQLDGRWADHCQELFIAFGHAKESIQLAHPITIRIGRCCAEFLLMQGKAAECEKLLIEVQEGAKVTEAEDSFAAAVHYLTLGRARIAQGKSEGLQNLELGYRGIVKRLGENNGLSVQVRKLIESVEQPSQVKCESEDLRSP